MVGADARAEDLDLALVPRLDGTRRILVSARQDFDPLDRRQRENVDPLDLDRVFVALLVDEVCDRSGRTTGVRFGVKLLRSAACR